jgi:carbonic anhydrase/acetyltransferase-like protein (isoleucine patch superfamily)
MSLEPYLQYSPVLGHRVYVAPSAVVIGRTTLGDDVSVWPTAVVRGDVFSIEIGARTNIQDGSVLHVAHDGPHNPGGRALIIGSDVTVGHRVVLHACTVGNASLIGMGSIVLDDAIIEDHVILGAGSVVAPGKRLESGGLYVGSPARRARELRPEEIEFLSYSASHYVKLKDDYLGMTAGA